ncbi:hypothetical protein BH10BDE1_BH10BDE1_08040 [soil metagenome]
MEWLSAILLTLAIIEAIVLAIRRPRSVRLPSSSASVLLHFSKIWLAGPLSSFFQNHFLGVLFFSKLLGLAWPYRALTVPMTEWWAWPLLFFATDFLYYCEHRFKHSRRFFWANHAVHHSSRVMNLGEAYRLGWTGWLSTNVFFFIPLVFAGFRPADVFWMLMIQQVYQLLTHLDWVPKLGVLEIFFVTPSGHRVHHGTNPKYLNHNFGGVFIIFDRVFGTYVEETEPVRYGLVEPFESVNPILILLCGWRDLFVNSRRVFGASGLRATIAYAFGPLHNEASPVPETDSTVIPGSEEPRQVS